MKRSLIAHNINIILRHFRQGIYIASDDAIGNMAGVQLGEKSTEKLRAFGRLCLLCNGFYAPCPETNA